MNHLNAKSDHFVNKNKKLNCKPKGKILQDNVKSVEYRVKGNEYYKINNYIEAMENYNKCIAFAQNNTEFLSIGYANRSACHFHHKYYDECLHDIKLTEKSKCYPSDKMEKLMRRKANCETAILNLDFTHFTLADKILLTKLPQQKHPELPSMILECLELRKSQKHGHSIKTNSELKAGDITITEKPLVAILFPDKQYQYCANCLKQTYSLIPCPSCTSVMFCSQKCLKIAYIAFHKYECDVIDYLFSDTFTDFSLLVLRIFLQAISSFKEDIDQLINFEKSKISDKNTIIIYYQPIDYDDGCDNDDTDDSDKDFEDYQKNIGEILNCYQICVPSEYAEFENQKLDEIQIELLVQEVVCKMNKFQIKTDKHIGFIENFITRVYAIGQLYCNILQYALRCASLNEDHFYGLGIYPSYRLMKHSCAPNITPIFNGSIKYHMVIRPIKIGEQLYECYGKTLFHHTKRDKRQDILKSAHNLECHCEACLNDFKTMFNLPQNIDIPVIELRIEYSENLKEFAEHIIRICKHINTFSTASNYPSRELYRSETLLMTRMTYLLRHRFLNSYKKKTIKFDNDNNDGNDNDNGESK